MEMKTFLMISLCLCIYRKINKINKKPGWQKIEPNPMISNFSENAAMNANKNKTAKNIYFINGNGSFILLYIDISRIVGTDGPTPPTSNAFF